MSGIKPELSVDPTQPGGQSLDSLVAQYRRDQVPVVGAQGAAPSADLDALVQDYRKGLTETAQAPAPVAAPQEEKFSFQQARGQREASEKQYVEIAKGLLKRTDLSPDRRARLEKIVAESGGLLTNTITEDRNWLNNVGRGIMDGLAQTGLSIADLGTALVQLPLEWIDKAMPGDSHLFSGGHIPLTSVRDALHETMAESKEFYDPQGKAGFAGQVVGTVAGGLPTFGPVNAAAWRVLAPAIGKISPALAMAVEAGLKPGATIGQKIFAEAVASGSVDALQAADIVSNNDLYPTWEAKAKALGLTASLSAAGAVGGVAFRGFRDTKEIPLVDGLEDLSIAVDKVVQPKPKGTPSPADVRDMQAEAANRVKIRTRKINSKAAYEWNRMTPNQRAETYPDLSGHAGKKYSELPTSAKSQLKNSWASAVDAQLDNADAASALADYKERAGAIIKRQRATIKDERAERRRYEDIALKDDVVPFLYNRKAFLDAQAKNPDFLKNKDIVFMDLKALHETNNDISHAEGNARLNKAGFHMEEAGEAMGLTDERNMFRFGGDEFVAVVPPGRGHEFLDRVTSAFGEIENGPKSRKSRIEGTVASSLEEADAKLSQLKSSRAASEQRPVEGEQSTTEGPIVEKSVQAETIRPDELTPRAIAVKKLLKDLDEGKIDELELGRQLEQLGMSRDDAIEIYDEHVRDNALAKFVELERQIRPIYADRATPIEDRIKRIDELRAQQRELYTQYKFTNEELNSATKGMALPKPEDVFDFNSAKDDLKSAGSKHPEVLDELVADPSTTYAARAAITVLKGLNPAKAKRALELALDVAHGGKKKAPDLETINNAKKILEALGNTKRDHVDVLNELHVLGDAYGVKFEPVDNTNGRVHPRLLDDIVNDENNPIEYRIAIANLQKLSTEDAIQIVSDARRLAMDPRAQESGELSPERIDAAGKFLVEMGAGQHDPIDILSIINELLSAYDVHGLSELRHPTDAGINRALDLQHDFLLYVRDKYGRDVFMKLAMEGDMGPLTPEDAAQYESILRELNPDNSVKSIENKIDQYDAAIEDLENRIDRLRNENDPAADEDIKAFEDDLDQLVEERRQQERLLSKFKRAQEKHEDARSVNELIKDVNRTSKLQAELANAVPGSVGEYNAQLNMLREGLVPPKVDKDALITRILDNELSGSSDAIKKVVLGRVFRGEDPGTLIVEHQAVKTLVDAGATYRPSSKNGEARPTVETTPSTQEPPAATVSPGEPQGASTTEIPPTEGATPRAEGAQLGEEVDAEGATTAESAQIGPGAVEPNDAIAKTNKRKTAAPKTPKEFADRWKNLSVKQREELLNDAALAGKPLSRLPLAERARIIEILKDRPKTPGELMRELDALEDKIDKQLDKKQITDEEWGKQTAQIGEQRAKLRKLMSDDEARELIGEVDPKDPRLIDAPKYPMLSLDESQLDQVEAQIKNLSDIREQSGYLDDVNLARRFKTDVSALDDVQLRRHKQELLGMLQHGSKSEQDLIADRLADINTEIAKRGGGSTLGDISLGLSTKDVREDNLLTQAEQEITTKMVIGLKDKESLSAQASRIMDNPMSTMGDMWSKFRQMFERAIAPIEKLDATAGHLAQMYSGWAVRAEQFLFKRPFRYDSEMNAVPLNIRPLAAVVDGVGNRVGKLRAYLLAAKALESPGKSGLNEVAAQKVVSNATPEIQQAAREVTGFMNSVLLYAVDAGLISGKTAKLWMDMYVNYIPLHRIFEGQELVEGSAKTVGARANRAELKGARRVFFRLKQSGRDILDPIQAVVENTRRIIRESDMNRIGLQLLKAVREDPDRFAGIAEIKSNERVVIRGQAKAKFDMLQKVAKERGFDADEESLKQMVVMGTRSRLGKKNDRLIVFEDGKTVILRINPDLADAFSSLSPGDMNTIVKIIAAPTRVLKTGIILQPLFPPLAFLKDAMEGVIRSKYGMSPLGPFRGLGIALSDTKLAKLLGVTENEWLRKYRAGGGPYSALSASETRTNLSVTRAVYRGGKSVPLIHPIEALRRFARPFEEAVRIEEYRLAKNAGESDLVASVASRNVTIDFNQSGGQMQALNMMVPFLNPAIQSLATDARILREQPGRVAVIGAAMALGTWTLMAANDDDQEINDLRKTPYGELFMWFRLPDGTIAKLPKPYFWGQVFMTGAEYAWDKLKHDDPDAAARWRQAAGNAAWGIGLPALGQLYMGLKTNQTPFGNTPIVPQAMEDLLPMYQVQPNTSRVARGIGNALHVSPLRVDFVLGQAFGSLGRDVLNGVKLVEQADRMAPSPVAADLPVIGRLFGRYPGGNVEPIYTFYQKAGEIESVNNTIKYLEKNDPSKIPGVINNHVTEVVLAKVYSGARAQLAELRDHVKDVDKMDGATPKEKREIIDALMQAMIEIARQTNEIGRQVKSGIDAQPKQ